MSSREDHMREYQDALVAHVEVQLRAPTSLDAGGCTTGSRAHATRTRAAGRAGLRLVPHEVSR